MAIKQKKNLWILALIGLVYFIVLAFPNASMMGSKNPIVYLHTDEYVVYPSLEKMFRFGPTLSTAWGRIIIHGEYHYGYPFFFFSFLTLLPLRLIQGEAFFENIPTNIFILRQLMCVLPMILTAGVMTYVVTDYRKTWRTIFTFLFVLTVPAVVRNITHWWHPDPLMLLFVALTFLFLKLDKGRLGSHFYLAAAACGMATSIKLTGFFFFLAIPLYIVLVWRSEKLPFKKVALSAAGFVLVMALVIVLSNPFLFYEGPRNEMIAIQTEKTRELREGYTHDNNIYYRLGPQYWDWTLDQSYGGTNFPLFLLAVLFVTAIFQPKKHMHWILLAWIVPMGIYLMWFVSPKPDHYLLPIMLPLYATAIYGYDLISVFWKTDRKWMRWLGYAGVGMLGLVFFAQIVFQITETVEIIREFLVVG